MDRKRIAAGLLILAVCLIAALLSGCSENGGKKVPAASVADLETADIGVEVGVVFDTMVTKEFPDSTLCYFNTNFDLLAAVDAGKVNAIVCDETFAEQAIKRKNAYKIITKLADDDFAFAFAKESEATAEIYSQINSFLAKAGENGLFDELKEIWLGDDEAKKDVDYASLTGENGLLKFAVAIDGVEPFAYIKEGRYVGYEIDLVTRFCREYGYTLEVDNYDFTGLLAAVTTGKADFAGSCISVTEERKQTLDFSLPIHKGGVVIVAAVPAPVYSSIEELAGKRGGVITGTVFDKVISETIPDAKVEYINAAADLSVALDSGKIDYYVVDEPVARCLIAQNGHQSIIGMLADDHYGVIFRKDDEKSENLCRQMNSYLAKIKSDGSYDRLIDAWLGSDAENQVIDYEDLPSPNGVLTYAFSTNIGAPYVYVKDGKYAGYEMAIAVGFCREYGYGIKFFDTDFGGVLSAVSLGKSDFGSSGISITDERRESILFSDPVYDGGIAVVVRQNTDAGGAKAGFFASIADSFDKTFIRENRWKMFLSGIGITMLVTLLSALFGSVIGFLFFLIYRKGNRFVVTVFDFLSALLEKLPVVVILMILYYVIFGNVDINGVLVAVVGFTVLFSFGVLGLLRGGVEAVDFGQTEAALALGYTDNRAFLRMIFPQAVRHFMPGYKSSLVSLIKDTSIVGYIAVQDLTKISDIVRSRTYEPFFPLIATAVIYFLLAFVLIRIVKSVEICTDSKRRGPEKILKGVVTK